jgi:hypothetical protein
MEIAAAAGENSSRSSCENRPQMAESKELVTGSNFCTYLENTSPQMLVSVRSSPSACDLHGGDRQEHPASKYVVLRHTGIRICCVVGRRPVRRMDRGSW